MKNMKQTIQMLWSNSALMNANKIHWLLVALLFFINVSLISIPNYFGLLDGIESIDDVVGIEESLAAIYDSELPCSIDEEFSLSCGEVTQTQFAGYQLVVTDVVDTTGIEESTIFLGSKQVAIVYIDETDIAYMVSGDYRLLAGFDFASVKTAEHDFDTQPEYYAYVSDTVLSNIYFSFIGDQIFIIFASQFSQMLIYLFVVSVMFMILNYRVKIKKISYAAGVKIIIAAMTGPAIVTAVFGVFITAWASIGFIILFAIRILFLYYSINKSNEAIY